MCPADSLSEIRQADPVQLQPSAGRPVLLQHYSFSSPSKAAAAAAHQLWLSMLAPR